MENYLCFILFFQNLFKIEKKEIFYYIISKKYLRETYVPAEQF